MKSASKHLVAETGAITDVNPVLLKMLGYSLEVFIQRRLWEVSAFQDIEASREAFKALQVDEYIRYEPYIVPRNGFNNNNSHLHLKKLDPSSPK